MNKAQDIKQKLDDLINLTSDTEQYWYNHLFPLWFEQSDLKFSTWKKKLMDGENQAEDAKILKEVSLKIQQKGGAVFQRVILDFSMATDILVSGNKQIVKFILI
jgi:hypothetical protein